MAKTLNINVVNKVATYCQRGGDIVCGNSDYVIDFTFDAEWDAYPVKTARFVANGKIVDDVVFEGASVAVPIIHNALSVAVGVFSGNLKTTTPAIIACQKSILCEGGTPADPAPDVYHEIMELFNEELEGVVPTFEVDEVVTLEPGELAYVNIDNAAPSTPRISFGIPKGEPGKADVVQEMGDSETSAMSQKAVTEAYDALSQRIRVAEEKIDDIETGETSYQLPIPTVNTEKKLDGAGYYAVYVYYSSITINFGVFYYAPTALAQVIHAGENALRIDSDGSLVWQTVARTVDDNGKVVSTYTDYPYYYSIYTAKL